MLNKLLQFDVYMKMRFQLMKKAQKLKTYFVKTQFNQSSCRIHLADQRFH